MKGTKSKTFIIIASVFVLGIFSAVAIFNLIPRNESGAYYVKIGEEMSAKIDSLKIENNKLEIITSGDADQYCVKSTKSTPLKNAICWKKIEDDKASISVYSYKKYYIWIKDANGNISIPMSINTDNE